MEKNEVNPLYPDAMKTIAIDFDGVIHDNSLGYNDGKIEGEIIPGAKKAIRKMHKRGYKLVLFSCKARNDRLPVGGKTGKQLIKEWLTLNGIDKYFSDITAQKPSCWLLIDDNCYQFNTWGEFLYDMRGKV